MNPTNMVIFVKNNLLNKLKMKRITTLALIFTLFCASCNLKKENNEPTKEPSASAFTSFGKKITENNVLSADAMQNKFKNMNVGDTLNLKFTTTVNSVCKKKGCWMKLDLGDEKETMVRFKDYGFFMPLNCEDEEVIVNGKAYVTITPIEELQHYAKDAGKSDAEINAITEAKYTYAFLADGVLLKNND